MKSESGSKTPAKWRLSRTLRRRTEFRPIEADDVKYLWAAYKKGALASIGFSDLDMSPEEFRTALVQAVMGNLLSAWTLFGETAKGFIPVGVVLAWCPPGARYMLVSGALWMPWATKRNIIEGMVGFLNKIRKETPLQFAATEEHKRLYEVCAMHGIVRRIGTSHTAIPDHKSAIFETRNVIS